MKIKKICIFVVILVLFSLYGCYDEDINNTDDNDKNPESIGSYN
jgi:hypothetical protein